MRHLLTSALLLSSVLCFAKTHAPLPRPLMAAKTVYIQNQTGEAKVLDDCFSDLKEWGRFQIVDSPESADVVLVLSKSSSPQTLAGGTSKVWEPTANNGDGGYQNVSQPSQSINQVYVTLSLVGHDRQTLWSQTARWRWEWSHPVTGIIKELRKRMEEQGSH